MEADRKAIKRNLMNLIDFGYDVSFSESIRINKNGEEETIYTDWYLEREFSDAELRLLVDCLLFSKHIPYSRCKELIEKIEGLSNRYFKSKVKHVCNLPDNQPANKELFYSIEILDEAIEKNRQVKFHYTEYKTDKKMHLKTYDDGNVKEYLINPYQMVATNGRYYLIGNLEKYDNISHYRVDRIRDIEIVDAPAKPQRKVKGIENGLNLPKHMAEHIYMFSGESKRVTMKTKPFMAEEFIDWFGDGVTFTNETEHSVLAHVTANLKAMRFWVLQHAPYVSVVSPKEFADDVKKDLVAALEMYNEEEGG